MVRWYMHEESQQKKTGLQYTTTVWYGGSCTNQYNKLTDTSIQMQKYSASFTDVPYQTDVVNHDE